LSSPKDSKGCHIAMRANQIFIVICSFCFGALIALWLYALEQKPSNTRIEGTGTPLIGGPFALKDNKGGLKSDKDFAGQYMLIYFGYSFCPDVCPTDLQKMSRALDLAKDRLPKIQPIFITIDPERDTPSQLDSYVSNFHPKLIGLTGSVEEIDKVKKAYKVYGIKVDENGKPTKTPKDDNYLMDHSPQTFLMGPDGKFIRYYRFSTTAQAIAQNLKKTIPAVQ